jgi:hypothetical protein
MVLAGALPARELVDRHSPLVGWNPFSPQDKRIESNGP